MKLIDADKLIAELKVDPVECPGCPEPEFLPELIQILENAEAVGSDSRGMYQCFHCGANSVIWQCDYDFSDFGYEGDGIVQMCQCQTCGAEIEYRVPSDFGEYMNPPEENDDILE